MSDWSEQKAREWLRKHGLHADSPLDRLRAASLAALLDECRDEGQERAAASAEEWGRLVRERDEWNYRARLEASEAARAAMAAAEERDDLEASWRIERASNEVAFRTLLAERDRLAAQVAALRESLLALLRESTTWNTAIEAKAVAAATDTQAAAEAHDVAVEKRGYELGRHDSKVDERSYRAGLERAAQIAESADNLHQWPGSEAQQIAAVRANDDGLGLELPKFGGWLNYPVSTAAAFLRDAGWTLHAHVLVLGSFAFCVMWRRPASTEEPAK